VERLLHVRGGRVELVQEEAVGLVPGDRLRRAEHRAAVADLRDADEVLGSELGAQQAHALQPQRLGELPDQGGLPDARRSPEEHRPHGRQTEQQLRDAGGGDGDGCLHAVTPEGSGSTSELRAAGARQRVFARSLPPGPVEGLGHPVVEDEPGKEPALGVEGEREGRPRRRSRCATRTWARVSGTKRAEPKGPTWLILAWMRSPYTRAAQPCSRAFSAGTPPTHRWNSSRYPCR